MVCSDKVVEMLKGYSLGRGTPYLIWKSQPDSLIAKFCGWTNFRRTAPESPRLLIFEPRPHFLRFTDNHDIRQFTKIQWNFFDIFSLSPILSQPLEHRYCPLPLSGRFFFPLTAIFSPSHRLATLAAI